MQTCNLCGDEIEFRVVDGQTTPIHLNGSWCSRGNPSTNAPKGWFRSSEAFTDPNAQCPVCGASVFYYENAFGSRVFFNALGWPWPKHGCTDNPVAQSAKIKRLAAKKRRVAGAFANSATLYDLDRIEESDGHLEIRFANIANRRVVRTLRLLIDDLFRQGWKIADLEDAPSFVIRKDQSKFTVRFISVRKGMVGTLLIPHPPLAR